MMRGPFQLMHHLTLNSYDLVRTKLCCYIVPELCDSKDMAHPSKKAFASLCTLPRSYSNTLIFVSKMVNFPPLSKEVLLREKLPKEKTVVLILFGNGKKPKRGNQRPLAILKMSVNAT